MKHINVGDRVRYTGSFLRSISCFTGPLPFARGTVTALRQLGLDLAVATVEWDRPDVPQRVNVANLIRCN
jgi:hypothetical protein